MLDVEPLSTSEVRAVAAAEPRVLTVVSNPHLDELTRRPFILDLLVNAATGGDAPEGLVGESHLIEWFWATRVRGHADIGGSEALKELARRQAELGIDQELLRRLASGALIRERHGRAGFEHDTIADWARLQWLLSRGTSVGKAIEERCGNPNWHRALRLLAVHRLEQSSTTADWLALIDTCPAVTDFALDGLLFAANSHDLLSRVTEQLFADKARLACRLARRAIVICSSANQSLLNHACANSDSPSPFLRILWRDPRPFHFFWGPLLHFLQHEKARVAATMAKSGAEVARTWLEMTPPRSRYRDVAADIALTIAERTLHERLRNRCRASDDDAKDIYQIALLVLKTSRHVRGACFSWHRLSRSLQQRNRGSAQASRFLAARPVNRQSQRYLGDAHGATPGSRTYQFS
ncbi:MAG TPA: hypothetical protein PK867_30320, partial [Pirellulales bacterium]|nr:hypothetical protein [Pirellulales bacterium]